MARDKGTLANIDGSDLVKYPNKRIKDNTGVGDGTPVDEFVYGDIHEFFAKLMRLYGITYNGVPDNEANGYQLIDALIGLASKNDYLLTASSLDATTIGIPIKLSLMKTNETLICIAGADRTTETQIRGTLDLVATSFVVTFKGGFHRLGDYLIITKKAAGVDIVRLAAGDSFEQVAEEYEFLKAASLVEERAGAISTKATTPLTNFTIFAERVNGLTESDPFLVTQTHNGLMSKEDKIKLDNIGGSADRYGTILVGDVAGGSVGNFYPVTGQVQSAQITQRTSKGNVITITLNPAMANSDYLVRVSTESLGNIEFDNDIKVVPFKKISASQFQIYYEETASVAQNLKAHVEVIQK